MKIALSEHFTFKKIFLITLSPILMMIFTSIYSLVDGVCISNFYNLEGFAGVNLIYPVIMVVGGLGFMFGTGGSALAGKKLGEGKRDEANQVFTNITIATLVFGIVMSILGTLLIRPIAYAMGNVSTAENKEIIVEEAIKYGRILMIGQFGFMLQNMFQNFFVVAEKPKLGFLFTGLAGLTNIVLDLLFIGAFKWGLEGAAVATALGYFVGAIGPVIYFFTHKNGNISFVKPKFNIRYILSSCLNGISEFFSNIAISVANLVINLLLFKYYGENGLNAYGIINYVVLVFIAIFIGYCIGFGPAISYNLGANNKEELKNCATKSMIIISVACVSMMILGEALAYPISLIFSQGDQDLINLTTYAMHIYSLTFLFCGVSMFMSSFFTALNNGLISALISILRLIVFQFSCVIILPLIFGGPGVWWSLPLCEGLSLITSLVFFFAFKKKYGY